MPSLKDVQGLPEGLPRELGVRLTLHEDERRRQQQKADRTAQEFERDHFEKGKFFQQEAERLGQCHDH